MARQLQTIGAGLTAPCTHDTDLTTPVYSMGCVLQLTTWALITGLLKEIHSLEKSTHKLTDAIDVAPIPLFGNREADVWEAAAELAAVYTAMREGLEPLERQVHEVFHRIVCSRVDSLDTFMHNAD
jgi:hypothetical protein